MDYMYLNNKPEAGKAFERIDAWLAHEIIDRVPVQFHRHDMSLKIDKSLGWDSLKERWFDSEYQVTRYIDSIEGRSFLAESFPVFWPNLGPDVFAAFYGIELRYTEDSSYAIHSKEPIPDLIDRLVFSKENGYFKKLEEMTKLALEMSEERYFVGYSDFQPGFGAVAAWRNPESLCLDIIMEPDGVKQMLEIATLDSIH